MKTTQAHATPSRAQRRAEQRALMLQAIDRAVVSAQIITPPDARALALVARWKREQARKA